MIKKKYCIALLAVLLAFSAQACAASDPALTTGAGYMKMAKLLCGAFTEKTGVAVTEIYGGNIGQMLAQVERGNGASIVMSDKNSLSKVKHRVKFAEYNHLGYTPLVLAWRKGLEIDDPNDILRPFVKSVCYPDPRAAIYGRAAADYLKTTGTGEKIKDKLSQVSTVPQVLSYLASGEMDAGFINAAAARSGRDKLGGTIELAGGYAPIEMVAATVSGFEDSAGVRKFIEFLTTSEEARQILDKFGVR